MTKGSKNKGGRPRIKIDWEKVDEMCGWQCTGEEISKILGFDYDTLNRACKREHNHSFADHFAVKSVVGKMSLRRAQFTAATLNLNPTMLIWLGKQLLGQTDTQYFRHAGEDGGPIVTQYQLPSNGRDPVDIPETDEKPETA